MKVGTDAVLLGASVNISDAHSILDIGTGCGVIALMLAQRSNATIYAIDIDKLSIEQAEENFKKSPWSDQLLAIHLSLQNFAKDSKEKFDLIVSNPPFFENSLESTDPRKKLSKHSNALSHSELITGAVKLLSPGGSFEVIIPFSERDKFVNLALIENLYCEKELEIYPKKGKNANRIILRFSKEKKEIRISELTIRNVDNSFTEEYISLTKNYYIHF